MIQVFLPTHHTLLIPSNVLEGWFIIYSILTCNSIWPYIKYNKVYPRFGSSRDSTWTDEGLCSCSRSPCSGIYRHVISLMFFLWYYKLMLWKRDLVHERLPCMVSLRGKYRSERKELKFHMTFDGYHIYLFKAWSISSKSNISCYCRRALSFCHIWKSRQVREWTWFCNSRSFHPSKKVCVGVLTYWEIVRRQLFNMCSHSLNRHRKHTLINKVICSIGRNSREEMRRRIVNVAIILFKY